MRALPAKIALKKPETAMLPGVFQGPRLCFRRGAGAA